jgi:hypothetical protein
MHDAVRLFDLVEADVAHAMKHLLRPWAMECGLRADPW